MGTGFDVAVVVAKLIRSLEKTNVRFVENSSPLHRRAMQSLAVGTVAEFSIQWVASGRILNGATVTLSPVPGFKSRQIAIVWGVGVCHCGLL